MDDVLHDKVRRLLDMTQDERKTALIGLMRAVLNDAEELRHWKAIFLDHPEDRLYHANDGTWWRRLDRVDGAPRDGHLVAAEPPPEIAKLEREVKQLRAKVKKLTNP